MIKEVFMHNPATSASFQKGVVLLTSLVLLFILTIIGIALFSTGTIQEKMASNNELITLQANAAQSAINAYMSNGMIVANGSLSDPANKGTNLVRRTWDATTVLQVPFKPLAGNAISSCVNNKGTATVSANCKNSTFQNTNTPAPIKAQSKAYYDGCSANLCGAGMAMSLGLGSTLGCPRFYVEGTSWLDLNKDGVPATDGSEPRIFVDEWLRWQRPVLCSTQ